MSSYRQYNQHLERLRATTNTDSLQSFSLCGSLRPAKVVRCIDGDTVELAMVIDDRVVKLHVRLMGVDAPELKPLLSNPDRDAIKREAKNAKDALQSLMPKNTICAIECCNFDKYGRLLASAIRVGDLNVIEKMVEQGFVVRVDNEKREKNWSVMWQQLQENRKQFETNVLSRNLPTFARKRKWWRRGPFSCC